MKLLFNKEKNKMGNPYKIYRKNEDILSLYGCIEDTIETLIDAFGESFETYIARMSKKGMTHKFYPEHDTIVKFCMSRLFGTMNFNFELSENTAWQISGWIENLPLQMMWMTFIVLRIAYDNEHPTNNTHTDVAAECILGDKSNTSVYVDVIKALYDERLRSWSDIINFTAINTIINRLGILGFISNATNIHSIILNGPGSVLLWCLENEIAKAAEVFK